jgi:hypothetical protein
MLRAGGPGPGTTFLLPLPLGGVGRRAPPRPTVERIAYCSPVVFNDIKHLARSMPADGLKAQDVVPGHFRRGDRFLGKAHTLARRSGDGSTSSHAAARAGRPRPAFAAFLAGAGHEDISRTAGFDPNRSFGSIHATCLWESLTTRWKRGMIPPLHE